jgi:outer membrane protein OmpA-like peptidoglycan-associated protein
MPKGTLTGGASSGQALALAQEIADSNNNVMNDLGRMSGQMGQMENQIGQLQSAQNQDLQTSRAALAKLEQLSTEQGSGSLTLFFAEGSATLNQFQTDRLIRFLDYLSVMSRGRKVILVSIGSASAVGPAALNMTLSSDRAAAPLPTINQYLVNTPHQFFKVSGVGDMYAPKDASAQVDLGYQSVRLIAAYDTAGLATQ